MTQKHVVIIALISFPMIIELLAHPFNTAPPDCKKFDICDQINDYPTELAKKLIAELKAKNVKFYDDKTFHPKDEMILENRFFSGEEIQVCQSSVEFKAPKYAWDINLDGQHVLNDDNDPVQRVRMEKCLNTNSTCSKQIQFQTEYQSECVQMWTQRELYYITKNNTSASNYFYIPICCSCKYRHN